MPEIGFETDGQRAGGAAEAAATLGRHGAVLIRNALDASALEGVCRSAAALYREIDTALDRAGPDGVAAILPAGERYSARASSATLGSLAEGEAWRRALALVAAGPAPGIAERVLGGPAACDLDQAWLRRQYAPRRYPPLHAPHRWHQDGALGFDFNAAGADASGSGGLLATLTCWCPLTPCGRDAPGLELVALPIGRVLAVAELAGDRIRAAYPEAAFRRPEMAPGDGLLFVGGTLHRTHVTAAMDADRTSFDLRLVAADKIPSRLAGDRFVPLKRVGTAGGGTEPIC